MELSRRGERGARSKSAANPQITVSMVDDEARSFKNVIEMCRNQIGNRQAHASALNPYFLVYIHVFFRIRKCILLSVISQCTHRGRGLIGAPVVLRQSPYPSRPIPVR